jgi:hypothetical protein
MEKHEAKVKEIEISTQDKFCDFIWRPFYLVFLSLSLSFIQFLAHKSEKKKNVKKVPKPDVMAKIYANNFFLFLAFRTFL